MMGEVFIGGGYATGAKSTVHPDGCTEVGWSSDVRRRRWCALSLALSMGMGMGMGMGVTSARTHVGDGGWRSDRVGAREHFLYMPTLHSFTLNKRDGPVVHNAQCEPYPSP
jgi:hypothetical protein